MAKRHSPAVDHYDRESTRSSRWKFLQRAINRHGRGEALFLGGGGRGSASGSRAESTIRRDHGHARRTPGLDHYRARGRFEPLTTAEKPGRLECRCRCPAASDPDRESAGWQPGRTVPRSVRCRGRDASIHLVSRRGITSARPHPGPLYGRNHGNPGPRRNFLIHHPSG